MHIQIVESVSCIDESKIVWIDWTACINAHSNHWICILHWWIQKCVSMHIQTIESVSCIDESKSVWIDWMVWMWAHIQTVGSVFSIYETTVVWIDSTVSIECTFKPFNLNLAFINPKLWIDWTVSNLYEYTFKLLSLYFPFLHHNDVNRLNGLDWCTFKLLNLYLALMNLRLCE